MLYTIFHIVLHGALYVAFFYFGRLSVLWWRNKYLDVKVAEAKQYAAEANELLQQAKLKDAEVRLKWQRMVSDISQYQFGDMPNKGQWTDLDQMYLNSWKSAEQ